MRLLGRLFLALVVIVIVSGAVYFVFNQGTEFSKFTFDIQRKKLPLVVMHFDHVDLEEGLLAYESYRETRRRHFLDYDYRVIFDGEALFSADGSKDNPWNRVYIESFARTSDYVNVITSPEYTELSSSDAEVILAHSAIFVGHLDLSSVYDHAVVLLLGKVDQGSEAELMQVVAETLVPFKGSVGYALALTDISQAPTTDFNYFALLKFEAEEKILDWLDNTIRKSRFGLLRGRVADVSLIVAVPTRHN